MPKEKSVGAVVFTIIEEIPFYLLLYYPGGYWDLPKGHVEEGERELDTARREVREETGLKDIRFEKGFREMIRYFFQAEGKTVSKTVAFYLAKTHTQRIHVSHEHTGYVWLVYGEARVHVKYQNAKEVLKKAHRFLHPFNKVSKGRVRGSQKNPQRPDKNISRRRRIYRAS